MSRGPRIRRIGGIAGPIVAGMVSQNVLTLVDTAMVGSLGADALAAVTSAGFLQYTLIALMMGLSSGVQAMAARRYGAAEGGTDTRSAEALDTGLVIAIAVGLPIGALAWLAAPALYPLVHDDPGVVAEAVPYLRARLLAAVAVGMNLSFRGYWNAVDRSRLYMNTLVVMHAANIVLSYLLIFGVAGFPALGAEGAGLGTTLSTWLGTALYLAMGWRHARPAGFLHHVPTLAEVRQLGRLIVPASVQQLLFALGITVLFTIIGTLGTSAVAAAGVLINVSLVAFLPAMALGMAAASLVGQALGHGDPEDAYRWGWDVVGVALVLLLVLGLPMWLTPDLLLTPFLRDAEPLALARPALRIVGVTLAFEAVGLVLMQALLGAGAARTVMLVSTSLQWGLFLPAAYVVGPVLGGSLVDIWMVQAVQRGLQASVFAALWVRRGWARIVV